MLCSNQTLEKRVQSSIFYVTEYTDGYVYKNGNLEYFSTPEGYVTPNGNSYRYVYQFKDHLDNVRLSYAKNDAGNFEIIEESNYYPFGLKHKGYNSAVSSLGNSTAQLLKFGGKELQDELGLVWYDISARNYDSALGRWMNLDPLAEDMRRHSPYNYAFDNPIFFVDPDGKMPVPINSLLNIGIQVTSGVLDEVVIEPAVYAKLDLPDHTSGGDNQYGAIRPAPEGAYDQNPVSALVTDVSYGVLALTGADAVDNLIATYSDDNIPIHSKVVATLQTFVTPGKGKGPNPKGKPRRPHLRKSTINKTWEANKNSDGKVIDPLGKEITWDKSKKRNGQWDMGHKPGEEYRRDWKLYQEGKLSWDEMKERYNDSNRYRPELPSTNRSHKLEEKDN